MRSSRICDEWFYTSHRSDHHKDCRTDHHTDHNTYHNTDHHTDHRTDQPYRLLPYKAPYRPPYRLPYRSQYRMPYRSPYRSPYISPYRSTYRSPYRSHNCGELKANFTTRPEDRQEKEEEKVQITLDHVHGSASFVHFSTELIDLQDLNGLYLRVPDRTINNQQDVVICYYHACARFRKRIVHTLTWYDLFDLCTFPRDDLYHMHNIRVYICPNPLICTMYRSGKSPSARRPKGKKKAAVGRTADDANSYFVPKKSAGVCT